MSCARLEKNVLDVICEQQLKLGYMDGDIRLYYPPQSLNALLGTDLDKPSLMQALETEFADFTADRLGRPAISDDGDRICLDFPPQAPLYVRDHMPDCAFLRSFIALIGSHHASMDQVTDLFRSASPDAVIRPMPDGDEGTLAYFAAGVPDDYRYCLTEEMGHVSYHRFTPEDFNLLYPGA